MGIRENELAAATVGINLGWHKALAFIIGSACAGLAGAFYAHFNSYISPQPFYLVASVNFLIMIVIGGLGSMPGAIIGAFLMTLGPEYLRFLADYRTVVFSAILVLFMMFLPGGLADIGRRAALVLSRRFHLIQVEQPSALKSGGMADATAQD